jgi:methionine sulfoxide reductase heme-binding subunit
MSDVEHPAARVPVSPLARLQGPRLVGWLAAALIGMTALIAALAGTDEAGVRMIIRATARTSLLLFLLAFTASSLRRLAPSPATAWLMRNRRYLGVSFAVSHGLHLLAILLVFWRWPHPFIEQSTGAVTLLGGGLGYVFLLAMTATSTNAAVAWLGARRWRLLHKAGGYYLWGIFALSYVGRAVEEPLYLPPTLALLGALGLRIAAHRRARSGKSVSRQHLALP